MLESTTHAANSLEPHWMPFTGNREFKRSPRIIAKAKGIELWDHKGRKLLDGSSGLFCSPAGHARQEIADAVHRQLQENSYASSFQIGHPISFTFAETLTRLLPETIDYAFFTNSGSESVDTAIKIALAYHRAKGEGHRNRFVSRERAYHGVNMGGLSLSGMVRNRETFSLTLPNISTIRHTHTGTTPFERGQPHEGADLALDLERLCETYGGNTIAAVFIEPIAGSTGVLVPPKGYLQKLRDICTAHGILLVFDEVITGFGRLGEDFAANAFDITPDMMTLAKALTNGCIPMGAVGANKEVYKTITEAAPENAVEFAHGYTYSAHPAACAAGLASLEIYEKEGLFLRAKELTPYFLDAVWSLQGHPMVKDLRGYGFMAAIEVESRGEKPGAQGTALQKAMFHNGLHAKFTGDNAILAPSFIVEKTQIDEMIDIFRKTLDKVAQSA